MCMHACDAGGCVEKKKPTNQPEHKHSIYAVWMLMMMLLRTPEYIVNCFGAELTRMQMD